VNSCSFTFNMFQTNPDFGGVSAYRLLLENPSAFACASIISEPARGASAGLASGMERQATKGVCHAAECYLGLGDHDEKK
jgi:hypothetical protein